MLMYGKSAFAGNLNLTLLDFSVIKFFHSAALQANQMVMMGVAGQLKHCLAAFKMVALEQPGLFKLGQYPVDRGQTDIIAFADERSVNIFRGEMPNRTAFEQAQYSKARQRSLQAHGLKIARVTHSASNRQVICCII